MEVSDNPIERRNTELAVPKRPINKRINILQQEDKLLEARRRNSTFTQFQDLLLSSIAMEYVPSYANPNNSNEQNCETNSFLSFNDMKKGIKHGDYDLKSADQKEITELIQKKKEKLEKKVQFFSQMPSTDQIIQAEKIPKITNWSLNLLDFDQMELIILVRDIFTSMDVFKKYNISMQTFNDFMWTMNYFYSRNNNPFHNFYHGVAVSHAAFYFLNTSDKFAHLLNPDEQFAFVVPALGHDLDHRGKSNTFEVNTSSQLALRYHDISPLEQHHAAVLFKVLVSPRTNLMQKIDVTKSRNIRKMMIENIKNTDMSVHFTMVAEFKGKLEADPEFGLPKSDGEYKDDEKILITNLLLHTADLSGATKEQKLAYRWSKLVNTEFSDQFREEQRMGLPLTKHFQDLQISKVFFKSESGYMRFIVLPLFELADEYCDGMLTKVVNHAKENQCFYEESYKAELQREEIGKNLVPFHQNSMEE